jgi:hypothetical protein
MRQDYLASHIQWRRKCRPVRDGALFLKKISQRKEVSGRQHSAPATIRSQNAHSENIVEVAGAGTQHLENPAIVSGHMAIPLELHVVSRSRPRCMP